jgi:hypothetical protein
MSDKPTSDVLAPCPLCGVAVQFRKALWPSDGCVDAIIHAAPTDCGMVEYSTGTFDESVIGKWNALPRQQDCARCADLEAALDGCLESMEWSTPQGWHAFDRARAARKGEG